MATAFNEKERMIITSDLKKAAMNYATTIGMRKTTVEDLAKQANISKGAFYSFFPSKEHLFFEIMEEWHDELYGTAAKLLETYQHLPTNQRVSKTILAIIDILDKMGIGKLLDDDFAIILRKIPEDMLLKHYHSDEQWLKNLFVESGIELPVTIEIMNSLIHTIFFTITNRTEIGEHYPEVLIILVESICNNIFSK